MRALQYQLQYPRADYKGRERLRNTTHRPIGLFRRCSLAVAVMLNTESTYSNAMTAFHSIKQYWQAQWPRGSHHATKLAGPAISLVPLSNTVVTNTRTNGGTVISQLLIHHSSSSCYHSTSSISLTITKPPSASHCSEHSIVSNACPSHQQ
jgi:hypothetical protein